MQFSFLLVLLATSLAASAAVGVFRKQPLSSSEKNAVGEALTKALQAMQNHAGGGKYAACADMYPGGKPPADQKQATWQACKNEFYANAAASLIQHPLSSGDKQAVGEALTKALQAMQNHAGSKYGACAGMYPDGKAPADQNNPTWIACKDQFYSYAAASLLQHPLTSGDKQAVGEALTKALQAMQNHAGGGKYAACADMYPGGKPPADQGEATWQACKNEFYSYAGASLIQHPLSSSDKQAVGEALTKALGAMQNHDGSKYGACASMFPDGKAPADQNSATWVACKSQFYAYAAASLVATTSVVHKGKQASLVVSSTELNRPLSSSDKQAVGEALTKALGAMQNHDGSKYGACASMFPDGKPPADQNSATWVACKSQFYAYAAASLISSTSVAHKGKQASLILSSSELNGPLSSSDKQAVGEALTKALGAMQNHDGSKYGACASMYPGGKPPADQNEATWVSCRDQFYTYAAASLIQQPLSSSDKQAVGEALTKALKSLQGHAGGSKYEACVGMYPEGKPPADRTKATWVACKDQFGHSLVGTNTVIQKGPPPAGLAGPGGPHHSSAVQAVPFAFLLAAALTL